MIRRTRSALPTNEKQARLTVVLEERRKQEFDAACRELGSNPSEVLRHLIVDYVRGSGRRAPGHAPPGANPPTPDSADDGG